MLLKLRYVGNKKKSISISGSKNSAVAIICASILSDGIVTLDNVANISDIKILFNILRKIGYEVTYNHNQAKIKRVKKLKTTIYDDSISCMRGSYYLIGSLLSQIGKVNISNPGGCDLGSRPINYHLDGFKKMNAKVYKKKNKIKVLGKNLQPSNITLPYPSVGATINLILASVKTKGTTIIDNCAKEPEVVDVANFLNSMGANITGAGSSCIMVNGVKTLSGCTYKIMPDRIEAGTYLILGALLGEITITNCNINDLDSVITLLEKIGCKITLGNQSITLEAREELKPFSITTGPYPLFPTDLGQPLSIIATKINGNSYIHETIFQKRDSHLSEIRKMGATCNINDNLITIKGKTTLINQSLKAYDLRGAAALVLAASTIPDFSYIDNIDVFLRGYEAPTDKLRCLGIESYLI